MIEMLASYIERAGIPIQMPDSYDRAIYTLSNRFRGKDLFTRRKNMMVSAARRADTQKIETNDELKEIARMRLEEIANGTFDFKTHTAGLNVKVGASAPTTEDDIREHRGKEEFDLNDTARRIAAEDAKVKDAFAPSSMFINKHSETKTDTSDDKKGD